MAISRDLKSKNTIPIDTMILKFWYYKKYISKKQCHVGQFYDFLELSGRHPSIEKCCVLLSWNNRFTYIYFLSCHKYVFTNFKFKCRIWFDLMIKVWYDDTGISWVQDLVNHSSEPLRLMFKAASCTKRVRKGKPERMQRSPRNTENYM